MIKKLDFSISRKDFCSKTVKLGLQSGQIDSQGRFFTGKTFKEYDKLLSTGAVDHLIIEPIKNKK